MISASNVNSVARVFLIETYFCPEEKTESFYRLLGKIRENFAMLQVIMPDASVGVTTHKS